MAAFGFAKDAGMFDSTPIENMFLLEYLPTAPEDFLRVYLYARMLALHPELGGDVAQLALTLRMKEKTVYDAFSYWERRGLVRRLTDKPPTYELLPVRGEEMGAGGPMEAEYYAYRDFNAALQSLFGARLIDSREYRIANDWLNVLGYDQDAVLRMVQYGIDQGGGRGDKGKPAPSTVFKRMDKLATAWADRGCRTLADVERAIAEEKVYPVAMAVLKRFALHREPSMDELECAKRWVDEWQLTEEQILAACEDTTKARNPSFGYLDAILKSRLSEQNGMWKELSDILRELNPQMARPSPDQLERYAALRNAGFEAETVKLAAIQCHQSNRTHFEDMEWMLGQWGELGLYSHEAAEAYVRDISAKAAQVRRVLEMCGLERRPTKNDLALYEKWKQEHDEAVIDYAATCARGMKLPMRYVDKLLTAWKEAGVTTVEAARAAHEANRDETSDSGSAPANPALDYAQRKYTEEDFQDGFFIDLDKYGEEDKGA